MNAPADTPPNAFAVGPAARAICAETCAFMGEPPCWNTGGWPNPECDEPGCFALARAALAALDRGK
jgi:hypothetical protein